MRFLGAKMCFSVFGLCTSITRLISTRFGKLIELFKALENGTEGKVEGIRPPLGCASEAGEGEAVRLADGTPLPAVGTALGLVGTAAAKEAAVRTAVPGT